MGSILSVLGGVFGFLASPAGQSMIGGAVKEIGDLANLVETLVHQVGTGVAAGVQSSTGIAITTPVAGVTVANQTGVQTGT